MNTVASLRALAERAVPFLRDEGAKYDDDGSNEPLELAREIEAALATTPAVEGGLQSLRDELTAMATKKDVQVRLDRVSGIMERIRLATAEQAQETSWLYRGQEIDKNMATVYNLLTDRAEAREPDGYHYVYTWPFNNNRTEVIVKDGNGGEWNGQKPLRSVPYYYTTPPPAPVVDDAWKNAVLNALAGTGMDAPHDEPPHSILNRIIRWHEEAATDPAISGVTAPVGVDGCTESNCPRCLTHPDHRGDMSHAGIGSYPPPPAPAAEQGDTCPKCGATSEDDAGSKCIPDGDSCPGVESPLAEAWAQPEARGVEDLPAQWDEMASSYAGDVRLMLTTCAAELRLRLAATPNPMRAEQPEGEGEWPKNLLVLGAPIHAVYVPPGYAIDGVAMRDERVLRFVAAAPAAPGAGVGVDAEELRRALCQIGVVGNIDGHDVIRRESVLDIIDRRRAALAGKAQEESNG